MLRAHLVLIFVAMSSPAMAAWPEDVVLSSMVDHDGARVTDTAALNADYRSVVAELGTAIANKPHAPAETLGASGFDFSVNNTMVFTNSRRADEGPSAWHRVHRDESPAPYLYVPTLSARKGLPFSLEAGANMAWVGMSRSGAFGGYARMSLVEGYKPAPDFTLNIGYAGYVGNQELELGVMDIGATIGSTFAFGTFPGINTGQISPYLNFNLLRVTAQPLLSPDLLSTIGIGPVTGKDAIMLPQIAGGLQITNATFLMRIVGSWAPSPALPDGFSDNGYSRRGVPTITFSLGWTY